MQTFKGSEVFGVNGEKVTVSRKPTTVTVTCEFGTFTRKTARVYKYVFLVKRDGEWAVRNWCGRLDLAWKQYADWKENFIANSYFRARGDFSAVAIVGVDGERVQYFETKDWSLADLPSRSHLTRNI